MKTYRPYRTYKFKGQDPIIFQVRSIVTHSGEKYTAISKSSGVSAQTMGNWFNGKTRRPQFATLNAVARALGWELLLTKEKK